MSLFYKSIHQRQPKSRQSLQHLLLAALLLSGPLTGLSQQLVVCVKDIPYTTQLRDRDKKHQLDIFYSKDGQKNKEVFIFIHGGGWKFGDKKTYRYFGKRMAEKGKVAVLVNYRLGNRQNYRDMAEDCAAATVWIRKHIDSLGGDPNKLFISGHSAGGHLAALIALDSAYLAKEKIKNPFKGVILIDAFGLNMYAFFKDPRYKPIRSVFYPIFSKDTIQWKSGSPVNYIHKSSVPFLLTVGDKTIRSIQEGNKEFLSSYTLSGNKASMIVVRRRRHIGMIRQFYKRSNPLYSEVIEFMETEGGTGSGITIKDAK